MKTLRYLSVLFLVILASACGKSSAPQESDAGDASISEASTLTPKFGPGAFPFGPRRPALRVQASVTKPSLKASPTNGPISPASWNVPEWDIDPANLTTCASDKNTCTSTTCGAAGTGIGPCRSYAQVVYRWGTTSPVLPQTTILRWMSSEASSTADPVVFNPVMSVNNTSVWIVGNLAAAATIHLSSVTAKLRSSNTLLSVQFTSGAPTVGTILHNTTHPSRAWVYTVSARTTMTQPLVLSSTAPTPMSTNLAEVDTWSAAAGGDAITPETPPTVNLRSFTPIFESPNTGTGNATAFVQHIYVPDPGGASAQLTSIHITPNVWVQESGIEPIVEFDPGPGLYYTSDGVFASYSNNYSPGGGYFYWTSVEAGFLGIGDFEQSNVIDGDVIIGGTAIFGGDSSALNGGGFITYGFSYLAGLFLASSNLVSYTSPYGGNALYGVGPIYGYITGSVNYPFGSGGATLTFPLSGGIGFANSSGGVLTTQGCLGNVAIDAGITACNVQVTAGNLDSVLGLTPGCIFQPGGAAFCNR